MEHKYLT